MEPALNTAMMHPQVRLCGEVGDAWLDRLFEGAAATEDGSPLVIEATTLGGDAEIGRRIALEVQLLRRRGSRRIVFLGKTAVYSAGVTIMAGFARADRFLTADANLLIHERQLQKDIGLHGPLKGCRHAVEALLAEIELGERLEREGFEALIEGSSVTLEELRTKAASNWYVSAAEAVERGLVEGIWP